MLQLAGRSSMWRPTVVGLVAALLMAVLVVNLAARASGGDGDRCARYAAASADRKAADAGTGRRVAVIGDSYSVGLGLDRPRDSWPARLPGRVHVDGFSGSGFSAGASGCGAVSFGDRAAAAAHGAAVVVVEGGLNDVDRSEEEIRAGFARLMRALAGHRVVVVGPAAAPARASRVARVDDLLRRLSADAGVRYVRMSGLELSYLDDGLHLTPAGHAEFGDAVAARLPR